MPSPKVNPVSSSSNADSLMSVPQQPVIYDEAAQVCRLDSYVSNPQLFVVENGVPNFRSIFSRQYAEQLAARIQPSLGNLAFSDAAPGAPAAASLPSVAQFSPLALFPLGCANEGTPEDLPTEPPINPPTENPPINPTEQNCKMGGGVNATLAEGACAYPVDLDVSTSGPGSVLMTCGKQAVGSDTTGVGLIERINASTGNKTTIQLPTSYNSQPIRLLSTVAGTGGIFYSGFGATGSTAEFEGGTRSYANSGIFTVNESSPAGATATAFQAIQAKSSGTVIPISLGNISGAGISGSVNQFAPNSPRAMAVSGNTLFVVNANQVLNPAVVAHNAATGENITPIDYAPLSIHAYTVGTNGALTAKQVTTQPVVVAGTNDPNNAYLAMGHFNPSSIAPVGSDRIAVLVQGIPGSNASSLMVLGTDFSNGLDSTNEIPLSDADAPGAPDFRAATGSQALAIFGGRYALVGSNDTSGRIAVVDLNRAEPADGTRVFFSTVFSNGSDIASIAVNEAGKYAIVTSTAGQSYQVNLDDASLGHLINDGTSLPTCHPQNTSSVGSELIPSAIVGNALVVARSGAYARVTLQP